MTTALTNGRHKAAITQGQHGSKVPPHTKSLNPRMRASQVRHGRFVRVSPPHAWPDDDSGMKTVPNHLAANRDNCSKGRYAAAEAQGRMHQMQDTENRATASQAKSRCSFGSRSHGFLPGFLMIALCLGGQTGAAQARVIDLSKASCAQFTSLAPADKEQIVLWLAGFYAGAAQRASLDTSLLSAARKAMDELCAKTPAAPLIGQETRPLLLGPASP
jgi:hypothetical protein